LPGESLRKSKGTKFERAPARFPHMLRDKDPSARAPLAKRLSRLLSLRRGRRAGSASAEAKGTTTTSSITGSDTDTAAGQAGPASDPAKEKETTAAALPTPGGNVPKPIVETGVVDMAPQPHPEAPTLPIALPDDPRVQHRFAILNGIRYHYLYAEPSSGKWRATVFLVCRAGCGSLG
jgi:hypothetical protein